MSHYDPSVLASVLTEEVLRLLRDPSPTSETYRKVAATCDDLSRLARAQEAVLKKEERLQALAEGKASGRRCATAG